MKTATFIKLVLVFLFTIPQISIAQVTILSANFTGESLPSGWSNSENAGSGDKWTFNDPGNRNISAGNFSGGYAIVDSDLYGSNSTQNTYLTTASFNTNSYTTITLEYDYLYKTYTNSEYCKVEVYDGSTWLPLTTYNSTNTNSPNSTKVVTDITLLTKGSSNAKVRFLYHSAWGYWFALDNVIITGIAPALEPNPKGPGGIGTNDGTSTLNAWYKPSSLQDISSNTPSDNEGVKYWIDASGNNKTLTNYGNAKFGCAPTDLNNGHPVLKATVLNRQFRTSSSVNARTLIAVSNPGTGNSFEPVLGFNGDKGIRRSGSGNNKWQFPGGGDGVNNDSWSTNSGKSYINGSSTNVGTFNNTLHFVSQTRTSNYSNTFYIGGYYPGRTFTGTISEVIIFNEELTLVEKIILDNYLSSKYNIPIAGSGTDYYTQDNIAAGNFDYNVAGIGKAIDGSFHTNSQGTGIIKINTPSHLDNDEYLFWGENTNNSTYEFSTTSTDYMDRQNSTWRVSKRNNLGSVTVSVAASDLDLTGKQSCASIRIIVSNSSTFSTKTTYDLTLSSGIYSATEVTFSDGDYFTFEYQDVIAVDNSSFYNGSGASNKPSAADACYKLLVKSTATGALSLAENANVREVQIETGGLITLNTGISLTVTGDISNAGTFTLEENSSLIQNTTGTNNNSGAGNFIVKRSGNNSSFIYNIWSSPIQSASLTSVFTDANPCDIWVFDRLTQAWSHDFAVGYSTSCYGNAVTFTANDVISGGDGVMDVTGGYFVPGSATSTKTYIGDVNNGDYNKVISITSLGNPGGSDWGDDDWNLLGNPYPSALSATAFWTENALNNTRITDALYFWDEADTIGGYNQNSDYASWNFTGGVNSGNSLEIPSGNIASGQGFWVVAKINTSVVFNNSMRTSSNSQFFKQNAQTKKHNAWFNFSSPSGYQNNILVGYNSATTDLEDPGFDAHKLVGNAHVRFASYIGTDEFVIQSIAPVRIGSTKTISLVVTSDEAGTHTFSGYKRENIPSNLKIYLRDKTLNIDTDLESTDYTVQLDANVEYNARFELVFINKFNNAGTGGLTKDGSNGADTTSTVTGITENNNSNFTVIQTENEIVISNKDGINGSIKIFDVTGKLVWKKENLNNQVTQAINLNTISSGTYFISIFKKGEKVFIKQWVNP